MRAGLHLGKKALDFVIEVFRGRVHGHANRVVGSAAKRLTSPVRPLIETRSDLYKSDGIDFVHTAGFRVVAYGRRVAGDGQEVAHPSNAPGPQERGLQA